MPRKAALKGAFFAVHAQITDESDNEHGYDEEGGDDQDSGMLEMLAILKEFQKRKSNKNGGRSAAFQAKKNALYAEARKNAETAVKEGIAYIEQYRVKVAELKAREVAQDQFVQDSSLFQSRKDALQAILSIFPPMLDDLSHRRAEAINDSSAMLESHSIERTHSRRRLIKEAKARIEEEQENQRVATDASALIKHYKALLRA